jgi:hypothetical protein
MPAPGGYAPGPEPRYDGYAPAPGPHPGYGPAPGPGYGVAPGAAPGYGPAPGPHPGYGPAPGPGYGVAPGAAPGYGPAPVMGYGPGPGMAAPMHGGPNWLLIGGLVAGAIVLLGGVGAGVWVIVARSALERPAATQPAEPEPEPEKPVQAPQDEWITAERPYVKFVKPPGWTMVSSGDWGVFRPPDGEAVLAFTMFNQPGQSTYKLGLASQVLGVGNIQWGEMHVGTVGRLGWASRWAEGSCEFHGPRGYIWYATVNPGGVDQILMIYTVSAGGTRAHREAALTAIGSLQPR